VLLTMEDECQDCKVAVPKDGNRTPRRAGACLPPIIGGHKARRYAELETVLVEALWLPDMSNELMPQPPSAPATHFDRVAHSLLWEVAESKGDANKKTAWFDSAHHDRKVQK